MFIGGTSVSIQTCILYLPCISNLHNELQRMDDKTCRKTKVLKLEKFLTSIKQREWYSAMIPYDLEVNIT